MSNQSSGFTPRRRIAWQKGVEPPKGPFPGDTAVPNQTSSFPRRSGIEIVREVDGSPSISDPTILEVSNGTLSEPSPGTARIDTTGVGLTVQETDGTPVVSGVDTLTFAQDGSVAAGPGGGEATITTSPLELREVLLTFGELVAAGTTINIQTGVYVGAGSPASLMGDTDVTLPSTGAAFKDDGRIEVKLNGQELSKGDGSGNGVAEWVSQTQIKVNLKIKNKGELLIRAPFPAV